MFLANSFKEKIKKSYLEGEEDEISTHEGHKYIPHKTDPRVLFSFKDSFKANPVLSSTCNLNSQQLQALDKTEWENAFTLKKLRLKWVGKTDLDFEPNFKKFPDEVMYPRSKVAKEYIKVLRDPDILEHKQKYWNISYNTKEKFRPELKKTLFEVRNGLKDFKIVPIKEQKVNEGVDTRDHLELDGNTWNISHLINEKQFRTEGKNNLTLAQENSHRYWKENEENRDGEKPFPLDEDRKKVEIIRYFKKYRSPYQKTIDLYNTMDKVKEMTFIEKENAEKKVKKENPGLLPRYPEKVNALVFKELNNTYKEKYNELTGKLSKEELRKRQIQQNKFKWKDKDLANKITAINKLNTSGILSLELDKDSYFSRLSQSQKREKRKNILLPLVIKGTEIELETERIKEKLQEDYKKQKKLEMLMELKTFKKKSSDNKFTSKFPQSKEEYEFNKKMEEKLNKDFTNKKEEILDRKIAYLTSSPNVNEDATKSVMNEISRNADCNPHFLEAFSKVAGKELERISSIEKKNKDKITYEYTHPGTFREFAFKEKVKKKIANNNNNQQNSGEPANEYEEKKVKTKFWSCCMNSDPNSPGCQRKAIKNFKYLYDDDL